MIQVINRAFDIIELLAIEPDTPKPLGEISSKLGLNAGTCANIIKTMVEREYLEKASSQKGYCLGPMIYSITGKEGYKKNLIKAAQEELESLTKKVNENSIVTVLNGEKRIVISRINCDHGVQATTSVEKNAFETTSGRFLIAMLPDEALKKYISKYGLPSLKIWPEAHTIKEFEKQVKKMRDDKYSVQKTYGDMVGLAVPIYYSDKVIACLGVYMPAFRFKTAEKEKIISMMKKSAERISKAV